MDHFNIKAGTVVSGLLIMTAGILLYLFNTGILAPEYKSIVFSWQSLLIGFGFISLFSSHKRISGIVLIVLGAFFLLPKLNIENLKMITQNGWAIALVAGGVLILCRAIWGRPFFRRPKVKCEDRVFGENNGPGRHSKPKERERAAGYIERNYIFGGAKEKPDIKSFKGGEINCIFGGMELDLTGSELADGVNILEINCVFAGVELYVPIDWNVEIKQSQIFGGFEDKRIKPAFEIDEKKILIVNISSIFGGGDIKSKN